MRANKATHVSRSKYLTSSRTLKVLAQRGQESVTAVGARVEGGQFLQDHPSVVALYLDESQRETRREEEEHLRRFQDDVRHRVAQARARRLQTANTLVTPDTGTSFKPHLKPRHESVRLLTAAQLENNMSELRRVRERLASYQVVSRRDCASEPLHDGWNLSPRRHTTVSHGPRKDQEEEDEDEEEVGQEEVEGYEFHQQLEVTDSRGRSPERLSRTLHGPDPGASRVLWPLSDQEEVKKQRQAQFLWNRRLFMSREREQVKENLEQRKHLRRTARFKAEKEHVRLREEGDLEREQQLVHARQKLHEREMLILERLKLEEEERTTEMRSRREKETEASRYVEALRAQLKERVGGQDLPPLCCCASTFWDSHPDTCANNCVFYNNPRAYAQALRSATLD